MKWYNEWLYILGSTVFLLGIVIGIPAYEKSKEPSITHENRVLWKYTENCSLSYKKHWKNGYILDIGNISYYCTNMVDAWQFLEKHGISPKATKSFRKFLDKERVR